MVIKSYSKVNLSLRVNNKLKNGLHNIQSFYCLINLNDKIEINKINKNKDRIIFKGPFSKLVKKRNNSVNILLTQLRKMSVISNYYSIVITKKIPTFSGLGGGTSNAAFILKHLLNHRVSNNLLSKLESKIGTDFKLFFKKQGYLKNLKTIIKFDKKQNFYFVLVQPKIRCSTKEIYSKVKKFSKKERSFKNLFISENKILDFLTQQRNDLQVIVERKHPVIKKLLKDIHQVRGCCFSRMTGSGSVCYGLFKNQNLAKKALNKLKIKYPKFWISVAKTV